MFGTLGEVVSRAAADLTGVAAVVVLSWSVGRVSVVVLCGGYDGGVGFADGAQGSEARADARGKDLEWLLAASAHGGCMRSLELKLVTREKLGFGDPT